MVVTCSSVGEILKLLVPITTFSSTGLVAQNQREGGKKKKGSPSEQTSVGLKTKPNVVLEDFRTHSTGVAVQKT